MACIFFTTAIPTSAITGSDMTGLGSGAGAGLEMSGPWNHPLMERRVFVADSTSDTYRG